MKTIILTFLLALVTSCSKDDAKTDPTFSLPPETQTGANTFGVTINGKVYIPRDPTGINWGGQQGKGMVWWGGGINPNQYNELVVVDGASSVGFKITIHLQKPCEVGLHVLKNSNFQNQSDSILENHIFFKIWDANISNYAYYGSIENQSDITITRRDSGIISAIFSGKFSRLDNSNDVINITNGRFDINTATLDIAVFP